MVPGSRRVAGRPFDPAIVRMELRPRRTPAVACRLWRHAGRDREARRSRPRPRRRVARALRAPAESEDATVRRVWILGTLTRSFPGKPAGRDRSRRKIWRLHGRGGEAIRKPPVAARVGSLLLLAARHDARNAETR